MDTDQFTMPLAWEMDQFNLFWETDQFMLPWEMDQIKLPWEMDQFQLPWEEKGQHPPKILTDTDGSLPSSYNDKI